MPSFGGSHHDGSFFSSERGGGRGVPSSSRFGGDVPSGGSSEFTEDHSHLLSFRGDIRSGRGFKIFVIPDCHPFQSLQAGHEELGFSSDQSVHLTRLQSDGEVLQLVAAVFPEAVDVLSQK